MTRFFAPLIFSYLAILPSLASASVEEGAAWLSGKQQTDGGVYAPDDLALDTQSTSEVINLSSEEIQLSTQIPAAKAFLQLKFEEGSAPQTEFIARALIAGITQDTNGNSLLALLLEAQNDDGGFGDKGSYQSTEFDTAYTLSALAKFDQQSYAAGMAVAYLLRTQNADGSWNLNDNPDTTVTALATRQLWHFRHRFQDVPDALQSAMQYLASQQLGSLWANDAQSALSLLAVLPIHTNPEALNDSVAAIEARQESTGAWANDVYSTALALRALLLASKPNTNPDLVSLNGKAVDADTGLPLVGTSVFLGGDAVQTALTNSQGEFIFADLESGSYTLDVQSEGYYGISWSGSIAPGKDRNLGDLPLVRIPDSENPTTGFIQGEITDAVSGEPLSGALISVIGTSLTATTDEAGQYLIAGVAPGTIEVTASKQGYTPKDGAADIDAGQILLFSVALSRLDQVASTVGGVISDALTGELLSDISISLSGANVDSAVTDATGSYQFNDLSVGSTTLLISSDVYHDVTAVIDVQPGIQYDASIGLYPLGEVVVPAPSQVQGMVVNGENGPSLENVEVELEVDGLIDVRYTDDEGMFSFEELPAGEVSITFRSEGFYERNLIFNLAEGITADLGKIALNSTDVVLGFGGVVLDSATNLPLSNVMVTVEKPSGTIVLITDSFGQFYLDNFGDKAVTLSFEKADYVSTDMVPVLEDGVVTDLGQVRLRYKDNTSFLPDLAIKDVDQNGVTTDPATLVATGALGVTLENPGISAVESDFDVVAFYDTDRDGVPGNLDIQLGQLRVTDTLNTELVLAIDIEGQLPYRDAPVSVIVDFNSEVVEADESNNVGQSTCLSDCVLQENESADPLCDRPFEAKLEWQWRGASGVSAHIFGPEMVAQITDDNNDGVIDSNDIPDIIFNSSSNDLVAVSGSTGETIWATSQYSVAGLGSPSVADIDGDGVVEIVTVSNNRQKIFAFEHTGDLKWSAATGPYKTSPRDSVSIADLNHDGSPEIIHGRRVYSADGVLLWQGTGHHGGESGYGIISIAADIDLAGDMEVIGGATAYNSDGSVKWHHSSVGQGFNAIGNFDDDDFAEIVLVSSGRLYVLEHTGAIKWGPVYIGGGTGGPPTVADVDGDNEPEIGIAGSRYFSVYETDGSRKWRRSISDYSSSRTGSSVFDFQADGRAELVYADEYNFRVYDGETGDVLLRIPNRSGTTLEYPVIADVDNDGSAEILIGGNSGSSSQRGVRVFGSANNDWVGTRSIWNQHSYHISNIESDGTVPANETHSWLDHNTYRLNRFDDAGAREIHDLTISLLEVVDNGTGNPLSISARIGNAGSLQSPATTVSFYRGSVDGELIGQVPLGTLQPDTYTDISLDGVSGLARGDTVVAVVNYESRFTECDGNNNLQQITVDAVLGTISVATDKLAYPADANVFITATVSNTGIFTSDYQLVWHIEDALGYQVAELLGANVNSLAGGDTQTYSLTWNTGQYVAGGYRVAASLLSQQGTELDLADADFVISATDVDGSLATAESVIATDKPVYQAWDTVQFFGSIRNNATNVSLPDATAILTVTSPVGEVLLEESYPVPGLSAQALQSIASQLNLVDAVSGLYTVSLQLVSDLDGSLLSVSMTTFSVQRTALQALLGTTAAAPTSVERGGQVNCTDELVNRSAADIVEVQINHLLLDVGQQQILKVTPETVTLSPGDNHTYVDGFDSANLAEGGYSCVQQVTVAGQTADISYDGFEVTPPPIEIASSFGGRGRILILLDDPLLNAPDDLSTLQQQYDYLRALLDAEGYSYTIVFNAEDFEAELSTGLYHSYALMSEQVTLLPDTEQILAEAVNSGSGLLISGAFNRRNNHVERALGIYVTGQETQADGVLLPALSLGGEWPETTVNPDTKLDFDLCGAHLVGSYINPVKGTQAEEGCYDLTGVDPAVAEYQYGEGQGVYIGFDALDEAAFANNENAYTELLRYGFRAIQPETFTPYKGSVVPVTFVISTETDSAELLLAFSLPDSLALVDSIPGFTLVDEQQQRWQWQGTLTANEPLEVTLYVQLLDDNPSTVVLDLEATLNGGVVTSLRNIFTLEPTAEQDELSEAIALLEALSQQGASNNVNLALGNALSAENKLAAGDLEGAISYLLQALEKLANESSEPTQQARLLLDMELFELLAQL